MQSRGWLLMIACASCGRIDFNASRAGNNVVFVTQSMQNGALGGVAGGDAICAREAAAAGLAGHYVAWLSTSATPAPARLVVPGTKTAARGWVRPDGRPFADTIADLEAGHIRYPIRLDASGNDLQPTPHAVLTGTAEEGALDNAGACADWTVGDASATFATGDLVRTTHDWTENGSNACSVAGHLYCFGVDTANPLPPLAPPAGRLAFVSTATFDTTKTFASADATCAAEAPGLTGTFRAYLATTTMTPASRFDPAPGPWYRVDGLPLASTGGASLAFTLDLPLSLAADGTPVVARVWTGSSKPSTVAATAAHDCADWSTNLATATGDTGKSTSSDAGFGDGSLACNMALPVYCFQL